MCVPNMRLKLVAVSELRFNGFNPHSRTLDKNPKFKRLLESVRRHGIFSPLLVSPDGLVIDGHRRLACAIRLSLQEVPCVVTSRNAQETWAEAVVNQQGINGRQLVEAVAQGLSPVYLPAADAKRVTDVQVVAGPELFQQMADEGISVGIHNALNKVCRYTGDDSPEWRTRVLRWLVKHKMQLQIRKVIESDPLNEDGTRERLRAAINRDDPLRATWS